MINDPVLYIVLILLVVIFKIAEPVFFRLFPATRKTVDVDWAITTAVEEGVLLVNNLRRNNELNGGAAAYTLAAAQHALRRLRSKGVHDETLDTIEKLVRVEYERQRDKSGDKA